MTTIYVTDPAALPQRRDNEFYPTERSLIKAALEAYAVEPVGGFIPLDCYPKRYIPRPGGYILDPGAGDGRWGLIAKALYPDALVTGVESRNVEKPDGFDGWLRRKDFTTFYPGVRYGLIVGNFPYGPKFAETRRNEKGEAVKVLIPLAELFIRHAFDLLAPGGRMIALLPLQLQAGKDRYNNLWITHAPTLVAVVSRRPSFGKNKHGRRGTNGTDYGLYIWDKSKDGHNVGTARRWQTELFIYEPEAGEV